MSRLSVGAIAATVGAGRTSAVTVAEQVNERVARYDRIQPQAWISRFSPGAILAAAAQVDARVAQGETLPLAGVPFAVKDNIDLAGLDTTAACPAFAYRPTHSAAVVERLIAAGAVAIGKTNLDQFATGLNGTRSPYGAPRCVYHRDYISGGSSSGSAVATAAGLVAFALGTDTAGSGRVPAAFNHLVGFKPSKGRWSTRGLVPACRSLDCISVFASSADDATMIDAIVAGFDPDDAYSRHRQDWPLAAAAAPLRIGVPVQAQREWFADHQAERLYAQALERLSAMGCTLAEVDMTPLQEAAALLYQGPWVAERSVALEKILGACPDAIDASVRQIVTAGFAIPATALFAGQHRLAALARQAERMWTQLDLLALPTAATIYRVREMRAAPLALNANLGRYTNFVNLLDMAAVAVPAGFRSNGTGFGISFIAPAHTDAALLAFAGRWEAASQFTIPALDIEENTVDTVTLAVVGAHLRDMPLHWQLSSREAQFLKATRTAPCYRLFAMAGGTPPKPALVHTADGASIDVELYALSMEAFGSFTHEVQPPLAIGTLMLEDGSQVKGFVAEPRALEGARDITAYGGWRAYIASQAES